MITKMFAIYDVKSDAYMSPFFAPAIGHAVRSFAELVNDKNTLVGRHPADFKLCHLADFDDSCGEVQGIRPVSLGFGTDFVEVKPADMASVIKRVS